MDMIEPQTDTLVLPKVVEIKPEWPKGYSRLGAAAIGMGDNERAKAAYEKGVPCSDNKKRMHDFSGPIQSITLWTRGRVIGYQYTWNVCNMQHIFLLHGAADG